MPFLVKDDLKTHIYPEILAEITRGDDDIITKCLSEAIGEAKGYLSRFDLIQIFGNASTEPTVDDEFLSVLRGFVKDIAAWKAIKLSNPNIDLKLFKTAYDDATIWLDKIQRGKIDPEGWPYKPDDSATPGNENTGIQWSSNKKRTQHY